MTTSANLILLAFVLRVTLGKTLVVDGSTLGELGYSDYIRGSALLMSLCYKRPTSLPSPLRRRLLSLIRIPQQSRSSSPMMY